MFPRSSGTVDEFTGNFFVHFMFSLARLNTTLIWSDLGLLVLNQGRLSMANGKIKTIVYDFLLNTKNDNIIAFIRVTFFKMRWYKVFIDIDIYIYIRTVCWPRESPIKSLH